MKKFAWRLQRLLDIKIKQEDAKRGELVAVTEQVVSIRSRIMLRRATLRQKLYEIGSLDAKERYYQQQVFVKYGQVVEAKITGMELELVEIENLRREKLREILEIRKYRKGLEKLREKARSEHLLAQSKLEQAELDERTSIRFARKIMQLA